MPVSDACKNHTVCRNAIFKLSKIIIEALKVSDRVRNLDSSGQSGKSNCAVLKGRQGEKAERQPDLCIADLVQTFAQASILDGLTARQLDVLCFGCQRSSNFDALGAVSRIEASNKARSLRLV